MSETLFEVTLPVLGNIVLSASSLIALLGILVSLLLSVIAIGISIASLKQNSKMIEESSRAVIGVYSDSINPGSPMLYLVIKNFGNSPAVITKFNYNFDFSDCYGFRSKRDYLSELNNCSIAPGQSRVCKLDYEKLDQPVTFDIAYTSCGKNYTDSFTVDLTQGVSMPTGKSATTDKELKAISYTLQEMLTKSL